MLVTATHASVKANKLSLTLLK